MCGIIGYTGNKQAEDILVKGLERLEYRGYDSSGIAVGDVNGDISCVKSLGKISELRKKLKENKLVGSVGIGHTRWATHGKPSDVNSHPHLSENGMFAVVHNGIIENFDALKAELIGNGVKFASETDSEVIAQLLAYYYDGDVCSAVRQTVNKLVGSYAVGIMCKDEPGAVYAIKKDNPLVIGLGKNENFIASDYAAALEYTHDFVRLEDGETARLTARSATFFDANGKPVEKTPYRVDWDISQAEKNGYPHFMLKEIFEQPKALTDTIRPRVHGDEIILDKLNFDEVNVSRIDRINIVGCGSAYHAGIVGKYFIEKHCRIRVDCILASEYIYSDPITDNRTLTIVISQSGETADSLAALRLAKKLGSHTIAIVNVMGSAIARDADDVFYTHAGPEIAVATTKGYTTQVAALYLVGLKIAKIKRTVSLERYKQLLKSILSLPEYVSQILLDTKTIETHAKRFCNQHCIFFIGRGTDYAASLEGALKLKEISYIHAEAYAAGELKHGTISLIENGTLTVALATSASLYLKTLSNIKSVESRGGTVLAVVSLGNKEIENVVKDVLYIPDCDDDVAPVPVAVILQIFAYHVAKERGCDIDKPRNLAKSVTVE